MTSVSFAGLAGVKVHTRSSLSTTMMASDSKLNWLSDATV